MFRAGAQAVNARQNSTAGRVEKIELLLGHYPRSRILFPIRKRGSPRRIARHARTSGIPSAVGNPAMSGDQRMMRRAHSRSVSVVCRDTLCGRLRRDRKRADKDCFRRGSRARFVRLYPSANDIRSDEPFERASLIELNFGKPDPRVSGGTTYIRNFDDVQKADPSANIADANILLRGKELCLRLRAH